ncbi:multicomponent Na+:H+ antiporter subunit G [Cohaesibacter sp. ES.047]|uniref:monovalent cation/H(+) antiporter subunit G n=1 Tax=Cohaesibacter sp. ES.047 TaxID=1798205 RepID=UPI000BB9026B|nr:monovalent cation/H(+) antiporter subunit G [Cohaesibacter sp. ES.047]SNY92775.1 multicomponent Na+:H+ antiporter subunit G [Cohaesibacter sp. ES.047]
MLTEISDFVVGVLLLISALFVLAASIGLNRFPDVYNRMHSASKAGTLGSGLAMLALVIHSADFSVAIQAFAGILFLFLTVTISGHLIARAAYLSGTKPCKTTVIDEYGSSIEKD